MASRGRISQTTPIIKHLEALSKQKKKGTNWEDSRFGVPILERLHENGLRTGEEKKKRGT
jgi:hypothetical protein